MIVKIQNFYWCLSLLFAIVKCANALLDLAEFSFSWVLLYVAPQFGCASELLINFEDQLLSVNFSITKILVDFE